MRDRKATGFFAPVKADVPWGRFADTDSASAESNDFRVGESQRADENDDNVEDADDESSSESASSEQSGSGENAAAKMPLGHKAEFSFRDEMCRESAQETALFQGLAKDDRGRHLAAMDALCHTCQTHVWLRYQQRVAARLLAVLVLIC